MWSSKAYLGIKAKKCFYVFLCLPLLYACTEVTFKSDNSYEGPSAVAYDVHTHYTESGSPRIIIDADEQLEFEHGDKEFPKGIFLRFYKESYGEKPYGDLKADFAHYYIKKGHWFLRGNVIYRDIEDGEVLTTEEIYWEPKSHKLWTDVFVHITAPNREIMGEGLEALDDFSKYTITKPRGREKNFN